MPRALLSCRWMMSAAGVVLLLVASGIYGGTTGKITGTVTDPRGSPLPGVAVQIPGLRLGAVTDTDGRYFVLQVPSGQHVVQADMVGYRTTIVRDVAVYADRTTTVDFALQEEAIEVAPVIVTAGRPDIEKDVTSSQITVDASKMAEAPVSQMLDYLAYEPGVSVANDNELQIRGGGPSEIRFQVDGLDRTDALTSKAFTKLNQALVSEVTLLTGGFNAEYGNVRSGMVNVVIRDGTERRGFGGLTAPWARGVYSTSPAQKKHFGPGAYDENQYDYWVALQSNSANGYAPIYWPDLYDETKNAPQFTDPTYDPDSNGIMNYTDPHNPLFKVFDGWTVRANKANALNPSLSGGKVRSGAYGKGTNFPNPKWTPAEVDTAWQWEANMNEQVWQYSNKPDQAIDLAAGWAIPNKLGGVVVGYSYNKEMTAVPAIRPYYTDQTIDTKLTLTPLDALKITVAYMAAQSRSTGSQVMSSPELLESGADVGIGSDPNPLRTAGQLIGTVSGGLQSENNKLHLSFNNLLDYDFRQWGTSLTYTFSPATYFTASFAQSHSTYDQKRDLPRVDVTNFSEDGYKPPTTFGYRYWLNYFYPSWKDANGDGKFVPKDDLPRNIQEATDPSRVNMYGPFGFVNFYDPVPSEGKYITTKMVFAPGDTATLVSPQGFVLEDYSDLSGTYWLGGGGGTVFNGVSDQTIVRGDVTHATGPHTFKAGAEFISANIEYHAEQSAGIGRNSDYRDYGGEWPEALPKILGIFLQDKFESEGMIANLGVRVERYDAGQREFLKNNLYVPSVPGPQNGQAIYNALLDSLGRVPTPGEVIYAVPWGKQDVWWRFAPRFGIAHPVTERTKFFFNYGQFFSQQKPQVAYGMVWHDQRLGQPGRMQNIFNPSLKPPKTTMYEVGIEHVFPFVMVMKLRGYAKYNIDQVSSIRVEVPATEGYVIYRNSNYEDVRGLEAKVSRSGRFLGGWITYNQYSTRSGQVALETVKQGLTLDNAVYKTAYVTVNQPLSSVQGLIRFSTPPDWGVVAGGWALSYLHSWSEGGQVIWHPVSTIPIRELPAENFLKARNTWTASIKFDKTIALSGGRSFSAYLDITNVFNNKYLNGGGIADYNEYLAQIVNRRRAGEDVRVGDASTFDLLTRPYKDANGAWKAPISPRTEWLLYMDPRAYRLGVRFDL